MTRLIEKSLAITVVMVGSACSPQQRNAMVGPSPIGEPVSTNIAVSGPADVTFPPRNELFLFRTNLETKYRDDLGREATTSFGPRLKPSRYFCSSCTRKSMARCAEETRLSRIEGLRAD